MNLECTGRHSSQGRAVLTSAIRYVLHISFLSAALTGCPQTLINRAANKLPDVPAAVPQHIGPSLPTPSITSDDDDDDDNNNDNNTRDGSSSLDNSEDARSEDSFHEMEISGDGSSAACPIDITVQPESDDM